MIDPEGRAYMRSVYAAELERAWCAGDPARVAHWTNEIEKLDAEATDLADLEAAAAGALSLSPTLQRRRAALQVGTSRTVRLSVDRAGNGSLRGVAVASVTEALGHGFRLDEMSLDQIAATLSGKPGRWTHGALFGDQLAQHLGRWQGLQREGEVLVGDFAFSRVAHEIAPDGVKTSAADYLMTRAQEDPESLGVSPVIAFSLAPADGAGLPVARVKDTFRADFVADPATNPRGLLGR
jgi:hypothetical protein